MKTYEDTYKVKPLEWYECIEGEYDCIAITILGIFGIKYDNPTWYWAYIFRRETDEGLFQCDSLEDGKKQANDYYVTVLERSLIKL
jgi:hypothetical protein